jgi:hypothetical protein
MPRVGSFTFPYTGEGYKAAKRTSKMLNAPLIDNSFDKENNEDDLYSLNTGNNLYSNVGNNLDTAFGSGMENRGGSRIMSSPGLSPPNFDTAVTTPQKFPWEDAKKMGGVYG